MFIENEFAALTDCALDSYALTISLADELSVANIDASLCFDCAEGESVDIDVSPEVLEEDFVSVVNTQTIGVLSLIKAVPN